MVVGTITTECLTNKNTLNLHFFSKTRHFNTTLIFPTTLNFSVLKDTATFHLDLSTSFSVLFFMN